MAVYAIGLTPLLNMMLHIVDGNKMVAFADDVTAVGKLQSLRAWWDNLMELGPMFGYTPQPTKSWLIVKEQHQERAKEIFGGTNIQISTRGERHLGAVIGSEDFKREYCQKLCNDWIDEITLLAEIAQTQPQSAYTCFTSGYQHKFSYYLRTIPGIENYLAPVEETIRHRLIPAITGGHIVNDEERSLLALPPRLGGLGIRNVTETAAVEYDNSRQLTTKLREEILDSWSEQAGKTREQIKNERRRESREKLDHLRQGMSEEQKRRNDSNSESGASNWLTSLPLKDHGYDLNKEQFWDALRIRYNWTILKLPTECVCGSKFDIAHALSCKKGGFVTMRHNNVRDITGSLLKEVCHGVRLEPTLMDLHGERFRQRGANRRQEARLDISAVGFWTPGQRVFLDVRVFDLNAQRYRGLELKKCFKRNEDEKKQQYNERVLEVENGSFTPLVFATNGGMARECKAFYKRLAEMVAEKRNITFPTATSYIRTKISFSLLKSTLICIRGARTLKRAEEINNTDDMALTNILSNIRQID